ncbi:MAG TPA: hypothetical protein VF607_10265 [Verrucomicrobiae bacterium]
MFGLSRLGAFCLLFVLCCSALLQAQAATTPVLYATNGTEYAVAGSLPGDQMFPDVAINSQGGYAVWQDNVTDGDGWGISAILLNATLSSAYSPFRVNANGVGDQENPHVTMLSTGGAAFVWQGGKRGQQHIYARFINSSNQFTTVSDILVNSNTNTFQIYPSITRLTNGNLVVVWSSFNQVSSTSLQDVFGQILSPAGAKIGAEFQINQFSVFNQRNPVVTALANGGFLVGWITEQQRSLSASNSVTATTGSTSGASVDLMARVFDSTGQAVTSEFMVNTDSLPCATPSVCAFASGGYAFAWSAHSTANITNGWDVFARTFTSGNVGGSVVAVNTNLLYDQYSPRLSAIGNDSLITWTSQMQDGSREGVYRRFLHNDGTFNTSEALVNTTVIGSQQQASVASDGGNNFLAVWTSFTGVPNSFDLFAQRYSDVSAVLIAPNAPFVWAPFSISNSAYQPSLVVTWPQVQGLSVLNYEVYADGNTAAPIATSATNNWTMTAANGLTVNTTHCFQVDYVTTDGRRSPLSSAGCGQTWQGYNWGGIPFEWMVTYYGNDLTKWPAASSNLSPRLTLYQAFLSGSNPLNPATWLNLQMQSTKQGTYISWNTQPGASYQVLYTADLKNWSAVGSARFATGTSDSLFVGQGNKGFYQIQMLR